MPRKSRIDVPGAVYDIIAKGIERKAIFRDDRDRADFLERLRTNLEERQIPCYAWAVRALGMRQTHLPGKLRISQPAVSMAVSRGEQLAKDHNFSIDNEYLIS